jgi:microcystin-dependent protein
MSDYYVGEVRLVGFNFAPLDWAICNGQQMSISGNPTLFNLIGTTYGGDGQTYFNIPNLQGRIPIHQGSNGVSTYVPGQIGGVETVTLSIAQYPAHNHSLLGSSNPSSTSNPANNTVGSGLTAYTSEAPETAMNGAMVGSSGGGNQPHQNLQPFLVLNWIIALFGIYPSQG